MEIFDTNHQLTAKDIQPGEKGEAGVYEIELKILADVGLVDC